MELLNRKTGLMEEVDDTHDAEWWRRPENAGELWVVKNQFREYKREKPWAAYRNFLRAYKNNGFLRREFGMLSIPSEEVWAELNSRTGRNSGIKRGRP